MLHLGAGMVVVVIVCVSFLLMMIVLGVVRIHRTQRHGNNNRGGASGGVACDEKNEMEWDNSALTITVNPMDQEEDAFADEALAGVHGNDSDSDDDLSSYQGDLAEDGMESSDEDDDEAVAGVRALKTRALEWDESDLSKFHCKV